VKIARLLTVLTLVSGLAWGPAPALAATPVPRLFGYRAVDMSPLVQQLERYGLETASVRKLQSRIGAYYRPEGYAAYEPYNKNLFLSDEFVDKDTLSIKKDLGPEQLSVLLHELDHAEKDLGKDPFSYEGNAIFPSWTPFSLEEAVVFPEKMVNRLGNAVVGTAALTGALAAAKAGFRAFPAAAATFPKLASGLAATSLLTAPLVALPVLATAGVVDALYTHYVEEKIRSYNPGSFPEKLLTSGSRGAVAALAIGASARLLQLLPVAKSSVLLAAAANWRGMLAAGALVAGWNVWRAARWAAKSSDTAGVHSATTSIFGHFLHETRNGRAKPGLEDPRICAEEVTGQLMQTNSLRMMRAIRAIAAYNTVPPDRNDPNRATLPADGTLVLPPRLKGARFWMPDSDHVAIYRDQDIAFDYKAHPDELKALWSGSLGLKPPMTAEELLDRMNHGQTPYFQELRAKARQGRAGATAGGDEWEKLRVSNP
jgi:hypothetical protein